MCLFSCILSSITLALWLLYLFLLFGLPHYNLIFPSFRHFLCKDLSVKSSQFILQILIIKRLPKQILLQFLPLQVTLVLFIQLFEVFKRGFGFKVIKYLVTLLQSLIELHIYLSAFYVTNSLI